MEITKVGDQNNPLMKNPIEIIKLTLAPKGKAIGLTISICVYNNFSFISKSSQSSTYYKAVPTNMRHNVWILTIGTNDPISSEQVLPDLKNAQIKDKFNEIRIVISKEDSTVNIRTNIG